MVTRKKLQAKRGRIQERTNNMRERPHTRGPMQERPHARHGHTHERERERERERGHIPEIMQATFSMSHTQQGLLTHIQHKSHTKRTHADAPKAVEYTVPGFLL